MTTALRCLTTSARGAVVATLLAATAADTFAADCSAIFPDGASNSRNNGIIELNWQSRIINSPDNILDTTDLRDGAGSGASCDGVSCSSSNTIVPNENYNSFPGGSNVNVGYNSTRTLSPGDYDDLTMGSSATLNLSPGVYTFNGDVGIGSSSRINVTSAGTVIVYVSGRTRFDSSVAVNSGTTDRHVFWFGRNDITLASSSVFQGVIYGLRDVTLNSQVAVIGAVTAERTIQLISASSITYDAAAISSMNFGTFCTSAPPPPAAACPAPNTLQPGIAGHYYDYTGQPFPSPPAPTGTPTATRVDNTVSFDWGTGSPGVAGIGPNRFAVRWEGVLRVETTGAYRFQTESDDGVRLWISDRQAIDEWNDHGRALHSSGPVQLQAGNAYAVRLDYYENGGSAVIGLRWQPPGASGYSTIPAGPTPTAGSGLYYCAQPPAATLVAEYRMDELAWTGAGGEVFDAAPGNQHGTAMGGADTLGDTPAVAGNPGTCRYGDFDGVDDYVEVGALSDTLGATASLAFWIRTSQTGSDTAYFAPGVAGVEMAGGTNDIFWGWLDASGRIGVSVGNTYAGTRSTTPVNDNRWHHVALTRDHVAGNFKVYVDGNLETSGSIGTGVITTAFSSLGRIEDTGGTPEYFDGQLDEVRIYEGVLTDAEVTAIMAETHPCLAEMCPTSTPQGGLLGQYYNSIDFTGGIAGERVDGPVDFDWGQGATGVTGVNDDVFSVRWEGTLRVTTSGTYYFQTVSDDGVRLWVDDLSSPVIDNWTQHSATTDTSAGVYLVAGQAYPIRLEFFDNQVHAIIRLRWQTPGSGSFTPIPAGPSPMLGAGLYHCPSGQPAYYSIAVNSTGITCEAQRVEVTAHDAGGAVMAPAAGLEIILSAAPADAGTAWVGGNNYIFTGTETTAVKALRQTTPRSLNLSVTDGTASEINSPVVEFFDAGLLFYGAGQPNAIPNQIAGQTYSSGSLRAVRTNTETGACEARVEGSQSVDLAFECVNPTTCVTGSSLSIAGSTAQANDLRAAPSAPLSYSPVPLVFDAAGYAPLPDMVYDDVGQLQLHAQLHVPENGDDPEVWLRGSSNQFVVKPFAIAVESVPGNSGSGAFLAAGESFSVRVEAQSASGARTPNFGNESSSEADFAISRALAYPSGGNAGTLTAGGAFSPVAGQPGLYESQNFRWSEVGSITLTPTLQDSDYLGAGDVGSITSSAVGQFFPHHFAMTDSEAGHACTFTDEVYLGHKAIELAFTVQARNAQGGTVENFDSSRLLATELAMTTTVYAEQADTVTLDTRVDADPASYTWTLGEANVTELVAINRSTVLEAPLTGVQMGVMLSGGLGNRQLNGLDMNSATTGDCTADSSCTAKALTGALELRFGRLRLKDSFGPETANLPVDFVTEYWGGSRWMPAVNDNCTQVPLSAISYDGSPIGASAASRTVSANGGSTIGEYEFSNLAADNAVQFLSGDAAHYFTAAGAVMEFPVTVDLTNLAWLTYDWNGDGNFTNDGPLAASIKFGSYRGHDRIIYWHEVLQ